MQVHLYIYKLLQTSTHIYTDMNIILDTYTYTNTQGALQQLRERQQILLKSSPLILFLISNTLSSHDHPAQNVSPQKSPIFP